MHTHTPLNLKHAGVHPSSHVSHLEDPLVKFSVWSVGSNEAARGGGGASRWSTLLMDSLSVWFPQVAAIFTS